MNFLEQKIMDEGTIKPGNILKVDNFLNHQIDIDIMRQIAYEFKRRFRGEPVTKILTIEGLPRIIRITQSSSTSHVSKGCTQM